nr:helix-turn-helix domain-containing protein [Actinomadura rayongensis]
MTGHSSRSDSAKFVWEWLEAHHQQPIGVADIAAAAGVSIRQLQVVCKEHWGQTPVQLLRGIRLDHARREILSGRSEFRRIGDVARAAGYVHMSRFAAHYKRRFGETPSQTLQRIRTR